MERMATVIPFPMMCFLSGIGMSVQTEGLGSPDKSITRETVIEIDYGGIKPSRSVRIPAVKGKTVLEMLQTVACMETHPVAGYVFIIAIDGVQGKRGETAWYYTIDDKAPGELAHTRVLDGTEGAMKWIFTKDACSWAVDGTLCAVKQ